MPSWNLYLGNFTVDVPQVTQCDDGSNLYEIRLSNHKTEMEVEISRTSNQVMALHEVMIEWTMRWGQDSGNGVKEVKLPKINGMETAEELRSYFQCLIVHISSDGCADVAEAFLIFADDSIDAHSSFYFANKCGAMNELFRVHAKQLHDLGQTVADDHIAIQGLNMRLGLLEESNAPSRRGSKASDLGAFVPLDSKKLDSRRNSYRSDGSHNTDNEANNSITFEDGVLSISDPGLPAGRRRYSNNSETEVPPVIFEGLLLERTPSYSKGGGGSGTPRSDASQKGLPKDMSPKEMSPKEMSFDSWLAAKNQELKMDSGLYGAECLVAPAMKPFENSEHLPIPLVPRNVEKGVQDEILDQVLMLVRAQKAQTVYRTVVARHFCRNIRKMLGLRADVIDLSKIKCNLPDDPIMISICMKTDMVNKWHSVMLPHFKRSIGTNSLAQSKDGGNSPSGGAGHGGVNGPYPTYAARMQGYTAQVQGATLSSSPEVYGSSAFRAHGGGQESGRYNLSGQSQDSGAETDFETLPEWKYVDFSITYATAHSVNVVEGSTRDESGKALQSMASMATGMDFPDASHFSKVVGSGLSAPDTLFKLGDAVPGSGVRDEEAITPKEEACIQVGVDSLAVVIGANKNTSASMVALVEQVSLLVGKNDLFKNSLLLIRSWWVYETAAYVGRNIRHYLSDDALTVMVIAIFNRNHSSLHQPLQALSVFLAEYSVVDWANQAVTIQGIVPFRAKSSPTLCPPVSGTADEAEAPPSYPWLINPARNHLLTPHWMRVFWGLANACDMPHVEPTVPTAVEAATASVVNSTGSETAGSAAPSGPSGCDIEEEGERAFECIPASESPEECVKHFTRCQVNIVNPLTHANLFLSRGGGTNSPLMRSPRGLDRKRALVRKRFLEKAFTTGAKKMAAALRLQTVDTRGGVYAQVSMSANLTLLGHFFNATSLRYSSGSRPDVFPGVYFDSDDDIDEISFDLSSFDREDGSRSRTFSSQSEGEASLNSALVSNSAQSSPRASFINPVSPPSSQGAAVASLWGIVQYHNLIVKKYLSGSALVMVVDEILESRGALPVGEIGKMLQEFKIPSLSSKLKEVFGGLKKFLEVHSHRYFLGDDHQFNPHVMLMKDIIAAGEQETIKHGINAEFVSRFKRTRPKRRPSNPHVHSDVSAASLSRLAAANVALDNYAVNRSLPVPPSTSNSPGSGRVRVKYGSGVDMPASQGPVRMPEQYLDPPYGGANNLSVEISRQYARHQHPQGGSFRGPPGMFQPQMQGQAEPVQQMQQGPKALRGHYGGLVNETGLSNMQEAPYGLSLPTTNSSGGTGTRSSAQNYQQQQYGMTPQHLDDPHLGNLSAGVSHYAHLGQGLHGTQAEQAQINMSNGMGWADSISTSVHGLDDTSQNRSRSDRLDDFSWHDS